MTTDPNIAVHQLDLIAEMCDEEGIAKVSNRGDLLSVSSRVRRLLMRLNAECGQMLNEIERLKELGQKISG